MNPPKSQFSGSIHRRVLENLSTAVLLLDSGLKVVFLNVAAEMLLKISHKRLLNSHFPDLFAQIEGTLISELETILESGHTYTQRECEFMLHNGDVLLLDCTVSNTQIEKKNILIIELQQKDRLLRISREEQLLESQETTKILIRGLAHEIKNPLGGIRGAAQLLQAELHSPELHEYTQIIMDESDRLRTLVDRMLGSNKLLVLQPTNIHEILERVCILIKAEVGDLISMDKDYDPSIPELMADKSQLVQAFLNIARNAMQALTPQAERGESARFKLRTRTLRQFTIGHTRHRLVVKVELIDNGPGIPRELIHSVFYPMISGRADGTGLGLSITQSIISKHDGLVECQSKPGETSFIVYLPLEYKK